MAVLTYRRPTCLTRIVPLLLEEAGRTGPSVTLLVIDNDPDAGARDLVSTTWPNSRLRYVHEPRPGIAAARNRALDEARACAARALVFIDDDEEPTEGWLRALVTVWLRTGAAAVTGPVEPVFAKRPDPWTLSSGRFARRTHADDTVLRSAASNNLLLDLATVTRLNLSFDESFGLTGGEDTLFTHELTSRGGAIAWSEAAVVRDHIPADRMTRSWILRREFRSGTTYTRMRLTRTGPGYRPLVRVDLITRGVIRFVGAGLRWAYGRTTGNVEHEARGACRATANAGLVAGALGYRYQEYRR